MEKCGIIVNLFMQIDILQGFLDFKDQKRIGFKLLIFVENLLIEKANIYLSKYVVKKNFKMRRFLK